MKVGFGDRAKLTPEIHRHYLRPFPDARRRRAPWELARALAGSGEWYESLWSRRALLAEKPTTILWGMEDGLLGRGYLERWREGLPAAWVVELPDVGHFVPEEADTEVIAREIREVGVR